MNFLKKFLPLLGLSLALNSPAFAAVSEPDRALLGQFRNLILNPGFESGKASWTASGGTFTTTSTAANLGEGGLSGSWDASGAQTLRTAAYTLPAGLYGRNCVGRILYKGGDTNLTLQVLDGSNTVLGSQALSTSTGFRADIVTFTCPSSGSVKLGLSAGADAAIVYLDNAYLGENFLLGDVNAITSWNTGLSFTPTGFGSPTDEVAYWRRIGDTMHVRGYFKGGTASATPGYLSLPTGYTINSSKYTGSTAKNRVGRALPLSNATTNTNGASGQEQQLFYDGSDTGKIWVANRTTGYAFEKRNVTDYFTNSDYVVYEFEIPITGWGAETAYRPEQLNWRVDANISGANPSLGSSDQTSYVGIEDGSLTLTNNTGGGVITANIPCSSTNAPTGTTCAAGNESVGVSFNLPVAGDAMACVSFSHHINVGASSTLEAVFQIVETPSNAQTISQEGKSRVESGTDTGNAIHQWQPLRVCGTFYFGSAGTKTLRLFYEQDIFAGTISANQIMGDASATIGQRDIHWEVYPINRALPAPVLVGSVTSNTTGTERIERAQVTVSNSAAAIVTQSGSWLSVANGAGAGLTTGTMTGFSGPPACTCTVVGAASTSASHCLFTAEPTSTTLLISRNRAGAAENGDVNIICMGPR